MLALMLIGTLCYCQVYKARDVGVNSVVLFPKVPDALKVMPMSFLYPCAEGIMLNGEHVVIGVGKRSRFL